MQVVTSVGTPSRDENVGAFAVPVDLIGGKKSPLSARSRRGQTREVGDDRWDPAVSDSTVGK